MSIVHQESIGICLSVERDAPFLMTYQKLEVLIPNAIMNLSASSPLLITHLVLSNINSVCQNKPSEPNTFGSKKKKVYDKLGHAGIQMYEQSGESDAVMSMILMGGCARFCIIATFLFTGCCFCFCCCFCCTCFRSNRGPGEYEYPDDEPTTDQPGAQPGMGEEGAMPMPPPKAYARPETTEDSEAKQAAAKAMMENMTEQEQEEIRARVNNRYGSFEPSPATGATVIPAPPSDSSSATAREPVDGVKERPQYCPHCSTSLAYSKGDECPACFEDIYSTDLKEE
ncbi:hypothetical protein SARC_10195 [Sphaeroforma arctica JP610]|uniref:Uncharacterized protein n=1 Tax=Sphaeroforma arctica JP610 TaxID=667725 RepID=A0A0L0FLI5_9EUKA|nr:hypothetical protein SARC_10195 [Sphaeroforma arctica JP610]KNC77346.1 hypothetical protein SARC_10195 [Sphaeroforma arctica JP610]|eukprot:XP_014151248.1 hypothetical protein SARC_10195 [Sphaeroforma arctica JP610]